jgi:hypothetical protein
MIGPERLQTTALATTLTSCGQSAIGGMQKNEWSRRTTHFFLNSNLASSSVGQTTCRHGMAGGHIRFTLMPIVYMIHRPTNGRSHFSEVRPPPGPGAGPPGRRLGNGPRPVTAGDIGVHTVTSRTPDRGPARGQGELPEPHRGSGHPCTLCEQPLFLATYLYAHNCALACMVWVKTPAGPE